MSKPITWSYGGGTQSIAIAVLIAQRSLPCPEFAVIADTGHEASETWEYLTKYVQPLLDTVGLKVEIAPPTLQKRGLKTEKGDLKKRVIMRYMRQRCYGPDNPAEMWIGFSRDEMGRCASSGVKWLEYSWPLLDMDGVIGQSFSRNDCRQLVIKAGLPDPPKSSCYFCPFRQNSQWKRLREHYPADWQNAVRLDEEMRAYDMQRGNTGVFVHKSRVPLAEANLEDAECCAVHPANTPRSWAHRVPLLCSI
jgi:hypothetical protein